MPHLYHHKGRPIAGAPHVFLATPAATFHGNYIHSLVDSLAALRDAGIAADYCLLTEHCHVDDARNGLVRAFMQTACDQMVFIDADVGWNAADLVKLIKAPRDFVAGVYPLKGGDHDFPVIVKPGIDLYSDSHGLVEVEAVPTGFLKLSRLCIEMMTAAHGSRKFYGRGDGPNDPPHIVLFERTYENGTRYSGDYAFCRKWKSIEGRIWVDPTFHFTHEGAFHWSGSLGDFWLTRHGVADERNLLDLNEGIKSLQSGDVSPETFLKINNGWANPAAAQLELLVAAHDAAKSLPGGSVIECGSGITTVVMAIANPSIHVHSLEDDPTWAARVNYALDHHNIRNATVHWAPLKRYESGRWYDISGIPEGDFAMALIDGPWRLKGERRIVFDQLGDRIVGPVLVDDVSKEPGQDDAMAAWARKRNYDCQLFGERKPFVILTPQALREAAE